MRADGTKLLAIFTTFLIVVGVLIRRNHLQPGHQPDRQIHTKLGVQLNATTQQRALVLPVRHVNRHSKRQKRKAKKSKAEKKKQKAGKKKAKAEKKKQEERKKADRKKLKKKVIQPLTVTEICDPKSEHVQHLCGACTKHCECKTKLCTNNMCASPGDQIRACRQLKRREILLKKRRNKLNRGGKGRKLCTKCYRFWQCASRRCIRRKCATDMWQRETCRRAKKRMANGKHQKPVSKDGPHQHRGSSHPEPHQHKNHLHRERDHEHDLGIMYYSGLKWHMCDPCSTAKDCGRYEGYCVRNKCVLHVTNIRHCKSEEGKIERLPTCATCLHWYDCSTKRCFQGFCVTVASDFHHCVAKYRRRRRSRRGWSRHAGGRG